MGKNESYYIQALNEAYLSHSLVVFYGAGLSKPFGLPEWKELIEHLEDYFGGEEYTRSKELEEKLSKNEFWLAISLLQEELNVSAESIKNQIGKVIREYEDMNCNAPMSLPCLDNNYSDLAKLDISLFITTNFDRILSRYMPGIETTDFLNHGQALKDRFDQHTKQIIHLHGTATDPQSIIISKKDVAKIYRDRFWKTGFETAANINTILFIGVSFSDLYLKNFLKQRAKTTNNRCYAIMLEGEPILDKLYSPIVVSKENPVKGIRDVLTKISKEPEYIIWLKLEKASDADDNAIDRLKREIKRTFDVFRGRVECSSSGAAVILLFSNCKTDKSLWDICKAVRETVEKMSADRSIASNRFVCFISKKTDLIIKASGTIHNSYKTGIRTVLNDYVSPGSHGFLFDRVELSLDGHDEQLRGFTDKRLRLEGLLELSLIVEDTVVIPHAENSGVEVHVAGLLFDRGRLILDERESHEAISPAKFSLPGGRLEKGESFHHAMTRILKQKYGISVGNYLNILDEFKVHDATIPGIAFVGNIKSNDGILRTYSAPEIQNLETSLACDQALINRAFSHIKRFTIKLRIIMLTECVYCCRCCHHENIVEQYSGCDIEKLINCIKTVSKNFFVKQITITGGEPLLPSNRDNLLKLLAYVRQDLGKVDLSVITNAHYLDAECVRQLKQYNIRYKISVYGYDNPSFLKYTGAAGCFSGEPELDYVGSLVEKLRILDRESCLVTLNIPFHKIIAPGLPVLLKEGPLSQAVRDYHIRLKIIEMVTPRRDSGYFSEDYESISEDIVTSFQQIESSLTPSVHDEGEQDSISIYRYPCRSADGCKNCINQFALTIKPNGNMLICKRALQNSKIKDNFFAELGIEVEEIDFKDEYHFSTSKSE